LYPESSTVNQWDVSKQYCEQILDLKFPDPPTDPHSGGVRETERGREAEAGAERDRDRDRDRDRRGVGGGLRKDLRPISGRKLITVSVGTPLCPYGVAYRGDCSLGVHAINPF
jgi:hypothetical protein